MDTAQNNSENNALNNLTPISPFQIQKMSRAETEEVDKFSRHIFSVAIVTVLFIIATATIVLIFLPAFNIPIVKIAILILGIVSAVLFILRTFKKNIALRLQSEQENQKSILKLLSDLSTQKTKVEQEKAKGDVILESIGEGLVVTDGRGKVLLMNKAAKMLLGWTTEELLNKNYVEIVEALDEEKNQVTYEKRPTILALTTAHKINGNYYYKRKDGSIFPVSLNVAPIIQNDEIVGSVAVFHNITKEVEVNRMKSEFMSVAAHQLRTPLGSMRWYLELLSNGKLGILSDDALDASKSALTCDLRLIQLVNDLLDVTRIDELRVADNPVETSVEKIINQAIAELMPQAKEKNIILNVQKPTEIPNIMIDPKRLREVFQNILSNSIKYNKLGGSVDIAISFADNFIRINIKDTGIGIPEKDIPRLTSKFFRATNAIHSETEGSGLGLYVVRSYVESWGGKVEIISEIDKGTEIILLLPKDPKNNILNRNINHG